MKLSITLSTNAAKAICRSVWTGPNCHSSFSISSHFQTEKDLFQYIEDHGGRIELTFLNQFLDDDGGPSTFLTYYVVKTKKYDLEEIDIARAYCLHHILWVNSAGNRFRQAGINDPYFQWLKIRKFRLMDDDVASYFFSCFGKVGEIVALEKGLATVETSFCTLNNVVVPEELREYKTVVIHFATAIASIDPSEGSKISAAQSDDKLFMGIANALPGDIDYKHFCGRNLSLYAQKNLR